MSTQPGATNKTINNTLYYETLGIAKDANPDEIKKAWRKTALRLHPDKNQGDPDSEAKFKVAKEAYEVLADPEKRAFYDKHGEEGLKLKEAYDHMDPSMLFMAFASMGWTGRGIIIVSIAIIFAIVLLFPIFLVLQIDGSITWTWPAIFSPLFAFVGIAACSLFTVTVCARGMPEVEKADRRKSCLNAIEDMHPVAEAFCLLAFVIVLSVWLNGGLPQAPLAAIFVPVFVLELLRLLGLRSEVKQSAFDKLKTELGDSFPFESRLEFVASTVSQQLLRISQWVLLVIKNDVASLRDNTLSWWLVFLPVWVAFGFALIRFAVRYMRVRKESKRKRANNGHVPGLEGEEMHKGATDEDDDKVTKDSGALICMQTCLLLPPAIFFILLCLRLSGNTLSLAAVFAPLFAVAGLSFCAVCTCVVCARVPKGGEWEGPEGAQGEGQGGAEAAAEGGSSGGAQTQTGAVQALKEMGADQGLAGADVEEMLSGTRAHVDAATKQEVHAAGAALGARSVSNEIETVRSQIPAIVILR